MEFAFFDIENCAASAGGGASEGSEGDLYIRNTSQRLDLAMLWLTDGPQRLHGRTLLRRIVIPTSPTLDDLLAASIAAAHFEGREIPAGMKSFARYAALVREGLRPSELPPDLSLEGIYLAIRNEAGPTLTEPASAERFLAGWKRLEGAIWAAATSGVDPFTTEFLSQDAEFARERAFLKQDQRVFLQDIARGERWTVQLPGGPPAAAALILNLPKSLLFKYWSRYDCDRSGNAFLLMGVNWGKGNWVFSTDPVQRLSLQTLFERLQYAETAIRTPTSANESWFDGARFGHTLVAAPRDGTRLDDAAVLRHFKQWAGAKPLRAPGGKGWIYSRRNQLASLSAAALVLLAVGFFFHRATRSHDETHSALSPSDESRGVERPSRFRSLDAALKGRNFAVFFAVNDYQKYRQDPAWHNLGNPIKDARDISKKLHDDYGFEAPSPSRDGRAPEVFADVTYQGIADELGKLRKKMTFNRADQLLIYFAGHGFYDSEVNSTGYFQPADLVKYSYNDLQKSIDGIECNHILVVLDVCEGGSFGDSFRGGHDMTSSASRDEIIAEAFSHKARLYFSSVGGENKFARDGDPGKNSPFAEHFLAALDLDPAYQESRHGVASATHIFDAVRNALGVGPQFGPFGHNEPGADFLFIKPEAVPKQPPTTTTAAP